MFIYPGILHLPWDEISDGYFNLVSKTISTLGYYIFPEMKYLMDILTWVPKLYLSWDEISDGYFNSGSKTISTLGYYIYLGMKYLMDILSQTKYPLVIIHGSHWDWKSGKTWKNGKAFSSQGKVREFCQDWKSQGKVREFCPKYWKNRKI